MIYRVTWNETNIRACNSMNTNKTYKWFQNRFLVSSYHILIRIIWIAASFLMQNIKYIIIRSLTYLAVACRFINMKQYVIHNHKIANFMRDKFELSWNHYTNSFSRGTNYIVTSFSLWIGILDILLSQHETQEIHRAQLIPHLQPEICIFK